MAVSSLFTLIDDIAGVLDDVAAMTKIATKKTVGVLGDDLALNAQQVSGVSADRELPVVWAVAKGSLVNKAILVPAALAIGAFAPWAVMKGLSLAGTVAMFLVGGGILAHGIPAIGHAIEGLGERLGAGDGTFGNIAASLTPMLLEGRVGVIAGGLALVVFRLVQRMREPAAVAKRGH